MDLEIIITCILSSTVAAAAVGAIKDIIIWRTNRKDSAAKEVKTELNDNAKQDERISIVEAGLQSINETLTNSLIQQQELYEAIIRTNKLILRDRIKVLATKCLKDGQITYEDRKLVHDMWDEYHQSWGGNGDLNLLLTNVDNLPLEVDTLN